VHRPGQRPGHDDAAFDGDQMLSIIVSDVILLAAGPSGFPTGR
jgi:hypothetical protein